MKRQANGQASKQQDPVHIRARFGEEEHDVVGSSAIIVVARESDETLETSCFGALPGNRASAERLVAAVLEAADRQGLLSWALARYMADEYESGDEDAVGYESVRQSMCEIIMTVCAMIVTEADADDIAIAHWLHRWVGEYSVLAGPHTKSEDVLRIAEKAAETWPGPKPPTEKGA